MTSTEQTQQGGGAPAPGSAPVAPFAEKARRTGSQLFELESNSVLIATILLVVVIGGLHPNFFEWDQIRNILQQSVFVGVLAMGMAFLLAMREIDLSVGSVFGLTLIVSAELMSHGMHPWLAGFLALPVGAGLGLVNAVLVQGIAIPAIIATLATLSMFRGLSIALTNGQQVTNTPLESSFFTKFGGNVAGLPVGVWVMFGTAIVLTAVLRLTPFGYRVRAIGSNPEAASFSGISIPRVRIQALVLMGLLGGLAGMLGLSFFLTGDPNIGTGFELQAIAAAIIGGTPLRGGSATIVGAMVGAILLGVVNAGLIYFNVTSNWSAFATGAVILLAVSIDSLVRRRRRARSSGGLGL